MSGRNCLILIKGDMGTHRVLLIKIQFMCFVDMMAEIISIPSKDTNSIVVNGIPLLLTKVLTVYNIPAAFNYSTMMISTFLEVEIIMAT